jgi:hypothetical protein
MPESNQDVPAESSSALTAAIASSPEVEQEVQQAPEAQTPPAVTEGVTQEQPQEEEPRIPYSRFKEKVDEVNYLRSLHEQQLRNQQVQQQLQQPVTDPYAGMPPEEKVFWQNVDRRAAEQARVIVQSEMQQVRPIIDAGRMELASMKVQQFRTQHPDIKPNSPEEMMIAEKIQQGYNPDDAYWTVQGPKGVRAVESQVKQQVKQQMAVKKQANVESSAGVPAQSQTIPKLSFREEFLKNLKLSEEGKL